MPALRNASWNSRRSFGFEPLRRSQITPVGESGPEPPDGRTMVVCRKLLPMRSRYQGWLGSACCNKPLAPRNHQILLRPHLCERWRARSAQEIFPDTDRARVSSASCMIACLLTHPGSRPRHGYLRNFLCRLVPRLRYHIYTQ